jgi:hypothetical protein
MASSANRVSRPSRWHVKPGPCLYQQQIVLLTGGRHQHRDGLGGGGKRALPYAVDGHQRVGFGIVGRDIALRDLVDHHVESGNNPLAPVAADGRHIDPVSFGKAETAGIRPVHEHHVALALDAAIAIVHAVDSRVVLIVGAQALQQQHRLIAHLFGMAGTLRQHRVRQGAGTKLGAAAGGIPRQLRRGVVQMKAARLLDARIEIGETGDGLLDEIANTPIVITQGEPVDNFATHGGMSHPRHYVGLGEAERRHRLGRTGRGVHHAEGILHRDLLVAGALDIELGSAEAGQDQRRLAHLQMAAVELGADLHIEQRLLHGPVGEVGVGGRCGQIAAQADEHLALAFVQRLERLIDIVTTSPRQAHPQVTLEPVDKGGGRLLVDPHGAVALHVAVAPYRTEPSPRLANLATHQVQVDDFTDGVDRVQMLGQPHGPAADDAAAGGKYPGRLHYVVSDQPGLQLDFGPAGGAHLRLILIKMAGVAGDEVAIHHLWRLFQHVLGHAANGGHVAAQLGRQILMADGGGCRGQQLERALRTGKALEGHLFEVVEADNLAAISRRLAQGIHHARMVGTRILAIDEHGLGTVKIIQHHCALADADRLSQRHPARLVAHVGAVGEVVGAKQAAKQLIEVGSLVAGTARGVELHLVRAVEPLEGIGDKLKGVVPAYRLIVIGRRIVAQRLGQPPLILQPVIALGGQLAHRVGRKKLGPHRLAGRLPGHRLSAVFTELEGAVIVVAPGTARAVEAVCLVDPQQILDVLAGLLAAQHLLHGGLQRRKTACFGRLFNMAHGTLRWDPPGDSWSS